MLEDAKNGFLENKFPKQDPSNQNTVSLEEESEELSYQRAAAHFREAGAKIPEAGPIIRLGGVGDVDSDAAGSGARYNGDKPDYSMMILEDYPLPPQTDINLREAWDCLARFQGTGDPDDLNAAVESAYRHGRSRTPEDQFVLEPAVRVWEFGQRKYKRWNWVAGMAWSIPVACAARHLLAVFEKDEYLDKESGQPHWAHFVCNIQMLQLFSRTYKEGNDLPYLIYNKKENSKFEATFPLSGFEIADKIYNTTGADEMICTFTATDVKTISKSESGISKNDK